MRSMHRAALAVIAVAFATSALTASAALAAPEWWVKSSGTTSKLASTLEVKATTSLTIEDTGWLGGVKVPCTGTIEGTIEPGGVGKINNYNVSHCENTGNCSTITVKSVNLPWKTELYTGEGRIRERLVSGGSGTPGWHFECSNGGERYEVLCNLNTSAKLTNKASGGVEAEFHAGESNKTACKPGGEEAGVWSGTVVLAHPASVEAIEAKDAKPGEWRQGGSSLTGTVATVWKGTVKVSDLGPGKVVECEDTGEGSVEPGGLGKYTKWTMSNCVNIGAVCETPITMTATGLPWGTQLLDFEGATHDLLTSKPTGFTFTCETILGKATDPCSGTFSTTMENVAAGVKATLVTEKERVKCTGTLGGEGKIEGVQTIEATKGGKLEVT